MTHLECNALLSRRDVLRITAGALTAPLWVRLLLDSAQAREVAPSSAPSLQALTADQFLSLDAMMEQILPETSTPGARTLGLALWVDRLLAAGPVVARETVTQGLAWMDSRSQGPFGNAASATQAAILTSMLEPTAPTLAREFFAGVKELAIYGYARSDLFYSQDSYTREYCGWEGA